MPLFWRHGCRATIGILGELIMNLFEIETFQSRFHYSFCVEDLARAHHFYVGVLGCVEGRSTETWFDVNLEGHELSIHHGTPIKTQRTGLVDGVKVPMPHIGLVLCYDAWDKFIDRLQANDWPFIVEPQTRFSGMPGEQRTAFVEDKDGNAIEFKGFASISKLFANN
jgi:uncharacterized protein